MRTLTNDRKLSRVAAVTLGVVVLALVIGLAVWPAISSMHCSSPAAHSVDWHGVTSTTPT